MRDHFSDKFSDNGQCDSDVYQESLHAVNERSSQLLYTVSDNVMSQSRLHKYKQRITLGCAAGIDGLMGEHLKHALGTPIIHHLCIMFSPRFHVSVNVNVSRKRKRNHQPTLSVIMSSVFPCIRFNYTAKTIILVANTNVKIIDKTVCFYFALRLS